MTRTELKTLKPGDIVYDKKDGLAYEFVQAEPFYYQWQLIGYDLLLKPCAGGEPVYINSKRIKY